MPPVKYLLSILSLVTSCVMAQNITKVEYYFDNDVANVTNIPITPTTDLIKNFTVPLSGLSKGFHQLHVRGKDSNAKWSILYSRTFVLQDNTQTAGVMPTITRMEYFIDSDPGFGNGIVVPIAPAPDITKNFTLPISGLSNGFHILYIRAKDANATWSTLTCKIFFIQPASSGAPFANITRIEYFLDSDPGFGNATAIGFTPGTDVLQNPVIDLSSISTGFHMFTIRARNGFGRWSLITNKPFIVSRTGSDIVAIEYRFFDGTSFTIPKRENGFTPGQNVTVDFNAILVGLLPNTTYEIHIVAINAAGQRSREVVKTFTTPAVICNIPKPTASDMSRCDNGTITLSASGATAPANYNWFDVASGGPALATGPTYSPTVSVTKTFYVNIVDGLGVCESLRRPVIASVVTTPTAPTTTGGLICAPSTVSLTASGGTNGQYRWYTSASGGVAISGETNSIYVTPVISSTKTYYVSLANGTCESQRTPAVAAFCNHAPVIAPTTIGTIIGGTVTLNLPGLITDADNNVDLSTLRVVDGPHSGASHSIDADFNLTLNYAGLPFVGSEGITIEVCDLSGECGQEIFGIEVSGDIIIYNAVSPNGDTKNEIFRIEYIDLRPETRRNSLSIFNRWGDSVFEVRDYDNVNRVFRGLNKDGNELPTGIYFYRLEFEGNSTPKTGFISLKR